MTIPKHNRHYTTVQDHGRAYVVGPDTKNTAGIVLRTDSGHTIHTNWMLTSDPLVTVMDAEFIATNNASTEDYDRQELDRVIAAVAYNQDDPDEMIGVSLSWGDAARLSAEVERLRDAVVKSDLAANQWRAQSPVTADHVARASVTAPKANEWQWAHRPACRPCALPSSMAIAMAINRWALIVNRPAQDILDEMSALEGEE